MSEVDQLKQKIAQMEQFWGTLRLKIERDIKSISTSGGGAGRVIELEFPVKTVTGNYAVNRHDYYIGVNSTDLTQITLPFTSYPGRQIVIKDESGNAQLNHIDIVGTIDNDSDGASIRINNGSITLIYNNGWRII